MGQTGFCAKLRFSAKICAFLRKSALPRCCNFREKRKSARKKLRIWLRLSLLVSHLEGMPDREEQQHCDQEDAFHIEERLKQWHDLHADVLCDTGFQLQPTPPTHPPTTHPPPHREPISMGNRFDTPTPTCKAKI